MTTQDERPRRPYAATANVMAVLERARTRNLPDKIDDDFLRIVGIPDVVFGRVQEALRFLGFTKQTNEPTDKFTALSAAPDQEYRALLEAALRDAYADDFAKVDPSQDTQAQMIDAFRPYEPRSQTKRMVMLFSGLCREAGIEVLDAPRQRGMRERRKVKPNTGSGRSTPAVKAEASSRNGALNRANTASLFEISDEDIAVLSEDEFVEVWDALGKVARARAKAKHPPFDPFVPSKDDDEDHKD